MSADDPTPHSSERRAVAGPVPPVVHHRAATRGVIDWVDALARMDEDAALLREVCAIFISDAPGIQARLEAAARSGDLAELQRVAHNLRGASATLSAGEVATLAGEVERHAGEGRLDEARVVALDAVSALMRLVVELQLSRHSARRAA